MEMEKPEPVTKSFLERKKKRKPKKICGLEVKKDTTRWNMAAIALVPICVMLLGSYLNV